jgi:hypothetical protein
VENERRVRVYPAPLTLTYTPIRSWVAGVLRTHVMRADDGTMGLLHHHGTVITPFWLLVVLVVRDHRSLPRLTLAWGWWLAGVAGLGWLGWAGRPRSQKAAPLGADGQHVPLDPEDTQSVNLWGRLDSVVDRHQVLGARRPPDRSQGRGPR